MADGLGGSLRLQNIQSLGPEDILRTLDGLNALIGWAQAQQARAVTRLETLSTRDLDPDEALDGSMDGVSDAETAFRLVASEIGALLSLPPMTAHRLVVDSSVLCSQCPAVLTELEAGRLSYRKAQIICSTVTSLPERTRSKLEDRLLSEAGGLTAAQLERTARRLYEGMVPEAELNVRHRQAKNDRRVLLEPQMDGMAFLSARLPAPEAQAIFTGLTTCARSEQTAGDPRTVDQLRTDIFMSLLLGESRSHRGDERMSFGSTSQDPRNRQDRKMRRDRPDRTDGAQDRPATSERPFAPLGPRVKAEVMVLVNAETLLGLDNAPAELHGYGPISADSARELVRSIGHWTGLLQGGNTGEILAVGRQRRVPPGLRRWLQARDSTCRFPGCSANALSAEIDHTIPWARGGPTEHGNLECLCRKHHAFKTAGFWTARQPEPGLLEWTSPAGRKYQTSAYLKVGAEMAGQRQDSQSRDSRMGTTYSATYGAAPAHGATPTYEARNEQYVAAGEPPPF